MLLVHGIGEHSGRYEHVGAAFLLDPRSIAQKRDQFEATLSGEHPAFVDFVLAEHHYRDGRYDDATAHYRRVVDLIPVDPRSDVLDVGVWLLARAQARLDKLTRETNTNAAAPGIQPGSSR